MKFNDYIGKEDFEGSGFVFITPDNLVLLLQKPNGKFSFVGGHREGSETPIETAKRECKEEIGFIPEGNAINFIKYKRTKTNTWGYSFVMKVKNTFDPKLSNEHTGFKWISKDNIKDVNISSAVKDIIPLLNTLV